MTALALRKTIVTDTTLPPDISVLRVHPKPAPKRGVYPYSWGQKGYSGIIICRQTKDYAEDFIKIETLDEEIMSVEKLKDAVAQYFKDHDGEVISIDSLMEKFPCYLQDLVSICEELKRENKIAEA